MKNLYTYLRGESEKEREERLMYERGMVRCGKCGRWAPIDKNCSYCGYSWRYNGAIAEQEDIERRKRRLDRKLDASITISKIAIAIAAIEIAAVLIASASGLLH